MLFVFQYVMVFFVSCSSFKNILLSVETQGANSDKKKVFGFVLQLNHNILQYRHVIILIMHVYYYTYFNKDVSLFN